MYSLHIRIVEANDLPKMDVIGSVDPYCQIQLNSMNQPKFTKKKKQTKKPVWNEEFHFPVRDIYAETLYIVLKDYDKVSADDPISQIQIPLKSLQISQVTDTWYQMVPYKGVKKGGKLRVVTHLGPSNEKPFQPTEKMDLNFNMPQQPNATQQSYQQAHRQTMLPNQYPSQMMMQQNQQKGRSNTMLPSDPQPYPYAMMMPSNMNQQNYQSNMMMQQQQNMMIPQQPNMMMQQPNLMMQQMNDQQFQSAPMIQPNGMQQIPAQQFASQPMMMQQMQPGMNQQNYQMNMMMPQQQMAQQQMLQQQMGLQMQPGMMMQPNYQNNMMMQQQMQPSMMMPQNYQNNTMMPQNVPK